MKFIKFLLPALFADFFILRFGGDSSSSSSSSTTNTSMAWDNRQALGDGAIGASGESSVSVTSNWVDPGALRAMETAMLSNTVATKAAIESASASAAAASAASSAAMGSAEKTQKQALDFASQADATNAESFSSLLQAGLDIFSLGTKSIEKATSKSFELVGATQSGLTNAYQTATAEKAGSLDNKTILLLGLAGAAMFAFVARKGR